MGLAYAQLFAFVMGGTLIVIGLILIVQQYRIWKRDGRD